MNSRFALLGLARFEAFGLLVARLGIGLMFAIVHGWPKLIGGPSRWEAIGGGISWTGITFAPAVWGFLAAMSETLGGVLIAIGFLFRPAAIFLFVTMVVAAGAHLILYDDAVAQASHAIKMAFVFFALIFVGPGRYSIDARV